MVGKRLLAVFLLFLCFESSFAALGASNQLTKAATNGSLKATFFERLQENLSSDKLGAALSKIMELHQDGDLFFDQYLAKHLEMFDSESIEHDLDQLLESHEPQLMTIAAKLGISLNVGSHNWTYVMSAWDKFEHGMAESAQKGNRTAQSLLQLGEDDPSPTPEPVLCNPELYPDAPCVGYWRLQFETLAVLAAFAVAQLELSGTFDYMSVATKFLTEGRLSHAEKKLLEKKLLMGRESIKKKMYVSTKTRAVKAKSFGARFLPLLIVLLTSLGDMISPMLMVISGMSAAIAGFDGRAWVARIPSIVNIFLLTAIVIGQVFFIYGDSHDRIYEKFRIKGHYQRMGVVIMTELGYFFVVFGVWLALWGSYDEIGMGTDEERIKLRRTGMIMFPIGIFVLMLIALAKGRGVQRQKQESKFRPIPFVCGVVFLFLTLLSFYKPLSVAHTTRGAYLALIGWMTCLVMSLLLMMFFFSRSLALKVIDPLPKLSRKGSMVNLNAMEKAAQDSGALRERGGVNLDEVSKALQSSSSQRRDPDRDVNKD